MIGMGLMKVMEKLGAGLKASSVISGAIMIFYGVFTGNSVSTLRAVIMFLLYAGAKVIGRTYDMLSALAFSGIFILAENPGYLYHSGFLLSYTAVAGIGVLVPALQMKDKRKKKSRVKEGLAGGIAVFLAQFPVMQYFFYEIPVFSLAVNLLVIPLLPLILASGFLGLVTGAGFPVLGKFFLTGACLLLRFYNLTGELLREVPFASLVTGQPAFWQAGVYYAALAALVGAGRRMSGKMFALGIVTVSVFLCLRPPGKFQLTMLDVGQGDCLAVETLTDHFYLTDGGSSSVQNVGTYRILPFMKQRGVGKVEGIFVTHGDEDHVNGIEELLGEIRVKQLFLPVWMREAEDQSLQKRAKEEKTAIRYLQQGDIIRDGDVTFHVLYPDEEETGEDGNSGSLTLKVEYGKLKILLTGDLTGNGEEKVKKENISCQILKVAHHGSGSSTDEEFLDKARPDFALISCGERNRYGHPAPELLRRLKSKGIRVYDTRKDGAVSFTCDERGRLTIETFH
jgi:competence protein ComEC